jgi:putative CocE/NonD family hydrolase
VPTETRTKVAFGTGPALEAGPYRIRVDNDVAVTADDDVDLATDLYFPVGAEDAPTIITRTPYGKSYAADTARFFASHGYNYVVQDVRGSGKSGGGDSDYFAEAADGRAAADWISRQPWFNGALGAHGGSYLGFTAWALASTRPPYLKALSVQLYSSDRRSSWYPGGSFNLETALPWALARAANSTLAGLGEALTNGGVAQAFLHLPLDEADKLTGGDGVPLFQDWMRFPATDPHWAPLDFSGLLATIDVPVLLVDGWLDYHLPYVIRDYEALRGAGATTRLVLGPWEHLTADPDIAELETLNWFNLHLKGEQGAASGVRYYVQPESGWREGTHWPPEGSSSATLFLGAPATLSAEAPTADTSSDRYLYDPADPTPALGGAAIAPPPASGRVEQGPLEARDDVLTFTAAPLGEALEAVGPVHATVFLRSSTPFTDVFAKLCDVGPDGRSFNVTEGLLRIDGDVAPADSDGVRQVTVDLAPTAYRFEAGHRLRLQLSSGAHPIFARNLGSGEPLGTGTTLVKADQEILHDREHPSSLTVLVSSDTASK